MKQVIIGGVVGGVLLFVWQFAAWMFLGIHDMEQEPLLKNEAAVVSALSGTARGVYWIPGLERKYHKETESDEYKAWAKRHEDGPRAWIVYDPEGSPPMDAKQMAIGGVVAFLIGLVSAWLLSRASIGSYGGRWVFVLGLGVFAALVMDVQGWVWMNHPTEWARAFVVDHVAGMALVGLALAAIVKGN